MYALKSRLDGDEKLKDQVTRKTELASQSHLIAEIQEIWLKTDPWTASNLNLLDEKLSSLTSSFPQLPVFYECLQYITKIMKLLRTDNLEAFNSTGSYYLMKTISSLIDTEEVLSDDLVAYRNQVVHGSVPSSDQTYEILKILIAQLKTVKVSVDHSKSKHRDVWRLIQTAFIGKPLENDLWETPSFDEREAALLKLSHEDLDQNLMLFFIEFWSLLMQKVHYCAQVFIMHYNALKDHYRKICPSLEALVNKYIKGLQNVRHPVQDVFTVHLETSRYLLLGPNEIIEAKTLKFIQ